MPYVDSCRRPAEWDDVEPNGPYACACAPRKLVQLDRERDFGKNS